MKLILSYPVIVLIFLLSAQSFSQDVKYSEKAAILLDKTKPTVYLEFVKTGKCTTGSGNFNFGDLCNSKDTKDKFAYTFDAFWLRLVNNTRWSIGVTLDKGATDANSTTVMIDSTAFVDDDGITRGIGKPLANSGAEMSVVYKSEAETGCDFSEKKPKGKSCFMIEVTPPEIPLPPLSSDLFVASGESVIFPVDFSHIKKYVNLYVLYNFEWEYSGQHFSHTPHYDLQHRTYFGWFDLEKGVKKETENKQKKNVS